MIETELADTSTALKKSRETSTPETAPAKAELPQKNRVLIIEGVRENGSKFRPSDWPERISSTFAVFGKDHRLHYTPGVSPRIVNGQKVLAVKPSMQERNPDVFQTIMKFARDNNLRIREEVDTAE
jgi:hypothetical protein